MGVKSTIRLTRADAEAKYVELRLTDPAVHRQFRSQAVCMDSTELENELEKLNDRNHGGEGFENYWIVADES